jgi:ADP-ribose pyrophosphatase YjhB (NUDIX family)
VSASSDTSPRRTRLFPILIFRLRAARYGWQIRTTQSTFELARFILLIPGVLIALATVGLAICGAIGTTPAIAVSTIRDSLPVAIAILVVVFVFAPIATIRYLGNLARIMDVAAWSEEGAQRLRRDMEIGMSNVAAYDQLIALYEPILAKVNDRLAQLDPPRKFERVTMKDSQGGSRGYAAIALSARSEESLSDLLGPIGQSEYTSLRMLADSRQRLMRTWRRIDQSQNELEDELGDNYCLRGLQFEPDGSLQLDVAVATYGEIMRSSDALINEFALFAYLCGPIGRRRRPSVHRRAVLEMSSRSVLRCLPWRRRVHREHRHCEHDLFLAPRSRAAGLGIAAVTMEDKDQEVHAYLGIRSGKVGTYPATNHVIPAGMCNTYGTNLGATTPDDRPPSEYLETVMKCEFLEEWTGAEEFESNKRRGWADQVNKMWKREIEDRVTQPLKLTGVAFDLLNLRPEICASIAVDTHDGALNWEFDQIGVQGPLEAMGNVDQTEIVQGGAAALMLAQLSQERQRKDEGDVNRKAKRSPSIAATNEDRWIPEDEYELIQRRVPIACVDLLPLKPDRSAVGLIRRETYGGEEGWCLIGGAVLKDEELLDAIRRHVKSTLGPDFLPDLSRAQPLTTIQYFTDPRLGDFHDPRKHAIALTYAAPCIGTAAARGEAREFRWFKRDQLPDVSFGFGQGKVVDQLLISLDETLVRSD